MNKLKHKLQKIRKKQKTESEQPLGRITNETVAEHREQILAGGRRFKYPMQYAKSSLVRNTILISLGALVLMLAFAWWQLYPVQNTTKFFYRITQLLPVPVAKVEGEFVRYSEYLMELRSALYYLEREDTVNFATADGQRQKDYQKRVALNKVEENAYIQKIAEENNTRVTNKEVDDFIDGQLKNRQPAVSREQYEQVIQDFYDWSFDEYRLSVKKQLLKRKVALVIDDKAKERANVIREQISADGANFADVASAQSDDQISKRSGGDVGPISRSNDDPDGLIAAAAKLQPNQVSAVLQGRDGYYIIKLLGSDKDNVHYARIFISLSELETRLEALRKDKDAIQEYINVPRDITTTERQ